MSSYISIEWTEKSNLLMHCTIHNIWMSALETFSHDLEHVHALFVTHRLAVSKTRAKGRKSFYALSTEACMYHPGEISGNEFLLIVEALMCGHQTLDLWAEGCQRMKKKRASLQRMSPTRPSIFAKLARPKQSSKLRSPINYKPWSDRQNSQAVGLQICPFHSSNAHLEIRRYNISTEKTIRSRAPLKKARGTRAFSNQVQVRYLVVSNESSTSRLMCCLALAMRPAGKFVIKYTPYGDPERKLCSDVRMSGFRIHAFVTDEVFRALSNQRVIRPFLYDKCAKSAFGFLAEILSRLLVQLRTSL